MSDNETLEIKIAFLEETVDTLNAQVGKQQLEIQELRKLIQLIQAEFRHTLKSDGMEIIDQRPPHY